MGMVVAPCSVRTWSEIAVCVSQPDEPGGRRDAEGAAPPRADGARKAAAPRASAHHGRGVRDGRHGLPPVPAFYAKPQTVEDIVDHSVGRALDLFGIEVPGVPRWREQGEA